ncbi:Imm51 family immunity protein [Kitasatospora sp. NPDC057015]|uniref:Imm51 family immunity protein n=1 Tax=Kitasatospora sp. NPDC057015 TaxID=3346001 RepID=UPI00362DE1AC
MTGKVRRGQKEAAWAAGADPAARAGREKIATVTIMLHDFDGQHSLTLDAGGLLADAAIADAGHEPNGYFWEGLVRFAWPDIAERLDFDSEAGMFCAVGSPSDLVQLKTAVESVITSPDAVRDIIARAENSGFEFDD